MQIISPLFKLNTHEGPHLPIAKAICYELHCTPLPPTYTSNSYVEVLTPSA